MKLFYDTANLHPFFRPPSPDKCEAVGHWPTMFSDDHDEDGSHQAHRVYGISEKVRNLRKWRTKSSERTFDLDAVNELT